MEQKLIKGKDLELDINIRTFGKISEEDIMEAVKKSKIPKYYSVFEVSLDLPKELTTHDDEIKMDNEKDGSISFTLLDARYKLREKHEHEEMNSVIDIIVSDLSELLKDFGILFMMWSCSSIE